MRLKFLAGTFGETGTQQRMVCLLSGRLFLHILHDALDSLAKNQFGQRYSGGLQLLCAEHHHYSLRLNEALTPNLCKLLHMHARKTVQGVLGAL